MGKFDHRVYVVQATLIISFDMCIINDNLRQISFKRSNGPKRKALIYFAVGKNREEKSRFAIKAAVLKCKQATDFCKLYHATESISIGIDGVRQV